MGTSDVTLYAIFKKDISVKFVDYNGTTRTETPFSTTIYNKDKYEVTTPAIHTYTDAQGTTWTARYWTTGTGANSETNKVNANTKIENITDSRTYYARYTKEITVSFELNGGTGTKPENKTGSVEVNSSNINTKLEPTITMPETTTTKEGYTFSGWNTKADGTGEHTYSTSGTFGENITLWAKWDINQYTLTVKPNGGKYKNSTANTEETQNYNTTINLGTLADTTGFKVTFNGNGGETPAAQTSTRKFNKWNLQTGAKGTLSGTTYTFGAGNDTATASWTNNSITLPTPEREGYTFSRMV